MPRGWYLAQGLIPLGHSSSDDEEGPCELPDGRLVCGPHGFVRCHRCFMDFSVMEEDDDCDEDGDCEEYDPPLVKGTGRVFPSRFVPPSASITPLQLFSKRQSSSSGKRVRFCHRDDDKILLLFTDGACLNNGQADPRAGWAFIDGEVDPGELEKLAGRVEKKGPFGASCLQTNNRAELRAAIAALRSHFWPSEGFHTAVIATDSEYVVDGATTWAKDWVKNGWKTQRYADVKNRDLWEVLLGEVEQYKRRDLAIQFWRIPREWNTAADAAAKEAATTQTAAERWVDAKRRRW